MNREINNEDMQVETCCADGQSTLICSALKGVRLTHKPTNIVVFSTNEKSQHANHLAAIELLKLELVKQRFENIDEEDLVDGKVFLEDLDSGKYD